MARKQYCYDYPRPAVTVDAVVLSRRTPRRVLLVRRKHAPFAGLWALPGGFVEMDEDLEAAARRELREETSIDVGQLSQFRTFGTPGRDPRGRTVSVVHLTEIDPDQVHAVGGDDASEARWFSLIRPPELAFDHAEILAQVRRHLKAAR